tara:strand:+ start:199 stop:393 length:195 start_codon:yes stop_codon:yes gene_type:complete
MADSNLNIDQKFLDSLVCNTCGSKGARVERTTLQDIAEFCEYDIVEEEWEIVVCSNCGSQDVEE